MSITLERLSVKELQQLQYLVNRARRRLQEVVADFKGDGRFAFYNYEGDITVIGFRELMRIYLGAGADDTLVVHTFISLLKNKPEKTVVVFPGAAAAVEDVTPSEAPKVYDFAMCVPGTSRAPDSSFPPKYLDELTGKFQLLESEWTSDYERDRAGAPRMMAYKSPLESVKLNDSDDSSTNSIPGAGATSWPFLASPGAAAMVSDSGKKKDSAEPMVRRKEDVDIKALWLSLQDVSYYISLLEGNNSQNKLEFVFRLYDSDGDGMLDKNEIEFIVDDMMDVAQSNDWDTSELRPMLHKIIMDMDYDDDGIISLEDWIRGGLTKTPILSLLGLELDQGEDGNHTWRLKTFKMPARCNVCFGLLFGLGKKGQCCIFCKFTVHEECAHLAPFTCIKTYTKAKSTGDILQHHWIEGNCSGKCVSCRRYISKYIAMNSRRCRWCAIIVHNSCVSEVSPECTLGENRSHIIPPTAIRPVVLDQRYDVTQEVTIFRHPTQPKSYRIESIEGTKPLLVLINPKSGRLQGYKMIMKFQYILNPKQVYNLLQDDPIQSLELFKNVKDLRVICCGGDGTIGWVLDMMDRVQFRTRPAVGIIPLGTDNDLSRCLNWGDSYQGEPIATLLKKIESSTLVMLDRWNIQIISEPPAGTLPGLRFSSSSVLTNYFSVGVDAAICVRFHSEREKNPDKFNSRMRNKLWYLQFAAAETFSASCRNLQDHVEIECDECMLDLSSGEPLQGIAILNISTTHNGTNLWGDTPSARGMLDVSTLFLEEAVGIPGGQRGGSLSIDLNNAVQGEYDRDGDCTNGNPLSLVLNMTVQDIGDGLIEVIGVESCLHIAEVRTGLRASGRRLAQCSKVTMRTKKSLPMQIDGEPWIQSPSTIIITHRARVPMLKAPGPSSN